MTFGNSEWIANHQNREEDGAMFNRIYSCVYGSQCLKGDLYALATGYLSANASGTASACAMPLPLNSR